MVDEVIPQEQMSLFTRPREMDEYASEKRIIDPTLDDRVVEKSLNEITDSGLPTDDPKVALSEFASFLIGLPDEKIRGMKSFVFRYPLVNEAMLETTQLLPEELNDVFSASLGDLKSSRRLLLKYGGEEAARAEEDAQQQMKEYQMSEEQEQPPEQMDQGRGLALPQ